MHTRRIDGSLVGDTLVARLGGEGPGHGLAESTRRRYAMRFSAMAKRIAPDSLSPTPAALVEHFQEMFRKKDVCQSTMRTYLSGAFFWLEEMASLRLSEGKPIDDYESAYQSLRRLRVKDLPSQSDRTSGAKLRFMPETLIPDLEMRAQSHGRSTKHLASLIAFLKANVLVGLRPIEWFDARFASYYPANELIQGASRRPKPVLALVVTNAKATFGRANGENRTILLHGASDEEIAWIVEFQRIVHAFAARYSRDVPVETISAEFFGQLQAAMRGQLKRLEYPSSQMPTLYSTRHQAIANAKRSGLTDVEIAATFGHRSTETSKFHYGIRKKGRGVFRFRPSPESMAAVSPAAHIGKPSVESMTLAKAWNGIRDLSP